MSLLFVVITISFSDLWSISRVFIVTFVSIMFVYELILAIFMVSLAAGGIIIGSLHAKKTLNDLRLKQYAYEKLVFSRCLLRYHSRTGCFIMLTGKLDKY